MKVLVISDTHELEYRMYANIWPPADVLVHCGDVTNCGSPFAFEQFNEWLGELDYKHKLMVIGNHDVMNWSDRESYEKLLSNAVVLNRTGVTINGVRFWGYDWTDVYFNPGPNAEQIMLEYEHIPEDTDVVITHMCPRSILDKTIDGREIGSTSLLEKVYGARPQFHLFGHCHDRQAIHEENGITFVNAAMIDAYFRVRINPIIIEVGE